MIHRSTISILLLLSILLMLIVGCSSPYKDILIPPMTEIEAVTDLIDQEVGLTPDQRVKVRDIVVDNAGMHNRILQQYAGRILDIKDHEKSRLQKMNRQLEVIFTPEQFEAWKPLYRAIYHNEMGGYDTPGEFKQDYNRRNDEYGGRGY